MRPKVCIITSVHQALDSRIFCKQALSLAGSGYDVVVIGQHNKDEVIETVKILPLPKPKSRLSRGVGLLSVLRKAYGERADIYHFHDPEFLAVAPWLKLLSPAKLIFDVHENVREQVIDKNWIPRRLRRPLSIAYGALERLALRFVDGIIIAEDSYVANYRSHDRVVCIHNYPLSSGEPPLRTPDDLLRLIYVGGLSSERGIIELVAATALLKRTHDVRLSLVGHCYSRDFEKTLKDRISDGGLDSVVENHGKVSFFAAQEFIRSAGIGLACLHPIPNYVDSLATKMFEYMAAGLPVVASNFPLWEQIVVQSRCGLTVDPLDPAAIASAIGWLIDNPDQAREMGLNGRQAVLKKYNWMLEEVKLLDFYDGLVSNAVQEAVT